MMRVKDDNEVEKRWRERENERERIGREHLKR
jgi:hypothetical protein